MWYIAKIVFQIKGKGMQRHQFDEHLRLIEAENFEEAFLKARMVGLAFEESIINQKHGVVQWEFVNVADLRPMKLKSGMELYSEVKEMDESAPYISYIHNQAAFMQLSAKPVF
ncbi:MAG TPA: DUF4288 domain-containing protein [Cyclobacteriaceae bacterium]|jgi:hypothetical protein|nr:DUF4288 domain-containing protein [Cyclobacteriaceae bacterium]